MKHAASFFEAFPVDPPHGESALQYIERIQAGGWHGTLEQR
jgi:hypothetical protein